MLAAPFPSQSSTNGKASVHAGGVKENSSLASNMQGSQLKGKAGAQTCLPAVAKSAGGKQLPMQLVSHPAVPKHLCADVTEWMLSELRLRVSRLPFSCPGVPPAQPNPPHPPTPPPQTSSPQNIPQPFSSPSTPSSTDHAPCQFPSKHSPPPPLPLVW